MDVSYSGYFILCGVKSWLCFCRFAAAWIAGVLDYKSMVDKLVSNDHCFLNIKLLYRPFLLNCIVFQIVSDLKVQYF